MRKTLIILLVVLICGITHSSAQSWRSATDTLVLPPRVSGAEGTIGYINALDTVPCKYRIAGDNTIYNGYRSVYRKEGYYTDDLKVTYNVFFDFTKRRIYNVHTYYFVYSF